LEATTLTASRLQREGAREIDDDGECEEERGGDCDRDRPTTTMI
jgi:hypothetical protein